MDTEKKKYSRFYFDIRLNWIFRIECENVTWADPKKKEEN